MLGDCLDYRELMHKREKLYAIMKKRKVSIPISNSHKPTNNRTFHKTTTIFKLFLFLHPISHNTALTSGTHCQRIEKPRA